MKVIIIFRSMESVYFTWAKSVPSTSPKPHWIQFNIKSADFQWSAPVGLSGQSRDSFPLQIRGPNGKLFPIMVDLSPCDNATVLTIHGKWSIYRVSQLKCTSCCIFFYFFKLEIACAT